MGTRRVGAFTNCAHWALVRHPFEQKCGRMRDDCARINSFWQSNEKYALTPREFIRRHSDKSNRNHGAGDTVPYCKMQARIDDKVSKEPNTSINLLTHSTYVLRSAWQTAVSRSPSDRLLAIDATAGRGSDTLSLCRLLGSQGVVHSIDIQQDAIDETQSRYEEMMRDSESKDESIAKLFLHQGCHSDLHARTGGVLNNESVAVITYNLGWYPGTNADRSIITQAESTVRSLKSAEQLLAPGGIISVMVYVGHDGGEREEEAVYDWASNLCSKKWTVVYLTYPNRNLAPTLLLCERRL